MLKAENAHLLANNSFFRVVCFCRRGLYKILQNFGQSGLDLYIRTDYQKLQDPALQYYDTINLFPCIAAPLMGLLTKEKQIVWTAVEATAARTLIACFTSFPVLALPDFNKLFFLPTNGSEAAIVVMILQQADNSKNA